MLSFVNARKSGVTKWLLTGKPRTGNPVPRFLNKSLDKINNKWCTQQENIQHKIEVLGDTNKKYFKRCNLFYNGEFIKEFEDIKTASKYA